MYDKQPGDQDTLLSSPPGPRPDSHYLASLQIVFKHDSLSKGQMNHLNAEGDETRDVNPDPTRRFRGEFATT